MPWAGEAGRADLFGEEPGEVRLRLGLHARGNLFGAELEQEIRHHDPPRLRGGGPLAEGEGWRGVSARFAG
jgi:hypothetical protein